MKPPFIILMACCSLLVSCGSSPLQEQIRVVFPAVPAAWKEILGEPSWRLEWYDPSGKGQCAEISAADTAAADAAGNASADIAILTQWPNAVLAWPYWPNKSLPPGLFYPAGAIYPLDVREEKITISWRGGIDAFFYRELDKVRYLNTSNRTPEYFDWKRFRALWQNSLEALEFDPWLADWRDIAEKTAQSGFRQSLVKAEKRGNANIVLPHDGPWIFASVFQPPQDWQDESIITLPLGKHPEILVCPAGFLSVTSSGQLWSLFP